MPYIYFCFHFNHLSYKKYKMKLIWSDFMIPFYSISIWYLVFCGSSWFVTECRTILEIHHLRKRTQKFESCYGMIQISGKLQLVCVIFVNTYFYWVCTTKYCQFLWVRMVSHWVDNTTSHELKHLSTSHVKLREK